MESLTQVEADALLAMSKVRATEEAHRFPASGERLSLALVSVDDKEQFYVDINRRSIALQKCTFNGRARSTIVLARLDLEGSPHRNPDGSEIACPHLHLYQEGYGDKWAYSVPASFADLKDLRRVCSDFLTYFN